jgi:hypothetical protein
MSGSLVEYTVFLDIRIGIMNTVLLQENTIQAFEVETDVTIFMYTLIL